MLAREIVAELTEKGSLLFPTVGFKGVFVYLGSGPNGLEVLLSWEIVNLCENRHNPLRNLVD